MKWLHRFVLRSNNVRIKHKMMFFLIFVVFMPVLFVGLYLTAEFRQTVLEHAIQQSANNVEKITKRTQDTLKLPIDISYKLMVDTDFKTLTTTNYNDTYAVVKAYFEYRDLTDYIKLFKEIHSIRFYVENPTMINNWEIIPTTEAIKAQSWYQQIIAKRNSKISWIYIVDETKGNQEALSLVRKVPLNTSQNGVLVISISTDELNEIVAQEPFDSMIVDEQGIIIAAKNTAWVGQSINDIDTDRNLYNKPKGHYEYDFQGQRAQIIIDEFVPNESDNSLRIISVFSIESIVGKANRINTLGMTLIVGTLVVSVALIYMFSMLLSSRLLTLNKYLNKVAMGDFATLPIDGKDEISLLAKQFNYMVSSIQELMKEVRESNQQKNQLILREKEIKLKMLASQINPHFLFNALESIRMRMHMKGETDIAKVVRLLGKLMRKNLEIGARDILLDDELEIVRCYLEIQQFRYGNDRLAFEFDIAPESRRIMVPPMMVQPLVENAVIHGLENMEKGGRLRIVTRIAAERLLVCVEDNGCGIAKQRQEELYVALRDAEDREEYRIGLRNIHQRLILTYGEECSGLTIASEPGQGTRISYSIPMEGMRFV